MNAALATVGAKYGIKANIGNIKYSESAFSCPLAVIVESAVADPRLESVAPESIIHLKKKCGDKALLKQITYNGRKMVVVGLRGSNFLVRVDGVDGVRKFKGRCFSEIYDAILNQ